MASAIPVRPRPEPPVETGLEPPGSIETPEVAAQLQEAFLRSLVESADLVEPRSPLPARSGGALQLATPEAIRDAFVDAWEGLSHSLHLNIDAGRALADLKDLVVYDIPDGTRSTLTVPTDGDIEADAALYCLSLVHTLVSLGAKTSVILTHTAYNRERGPQDTKRFLNIMARGIEPFKAYSWRHKTAIRVHGLRPGYELESAFRKAFPLPVDPRFDAHFLVDYQEEWFLTEEGRTFLEALPDIDVCVRHTKLQVSGGWVPIRMRKSAYVYSQNGTLASNWSYDEYAALVAVAYLAKLLLRGEALSKSYVSVDEIKGRFKERELQLGQKVVKLRAKPKKLFVLGSAAGLVQVYA